MNDKSPIFRSLAMIEENIRERLTVEMLAANAHFSKYHYQRIFREVVGETVIRYVTVRKLYFAAADLAATGDPVLEIALKYGYDSHEGFTRSFKAYSGVTPTEYRKYHSVLSFPERKKEQSPMVHSNHADELIRELNSLIVQAKETAAYTKKYREANAQAITPYGQFWELIAERTEKMAEELQEILKCVAAAQDWDETSARLMLVKAIDDAVFEADVTAFQAGLTISRAMPEHQTVFQPLCARYDSLAQNTKIKSRKMADFLNELFGLIIHDMRKQAERKIQNAIVSGRAAAEKLSDPALPYGYIADGVAAIVEELDSTALEDITLYSLRDSISALETIHFAAFMDILRAPQHRQLFDGISDFKVKLDEAASFFDGLWTIGQAENDPDSAEERACKDLAAQEGIVLFYLKGEIQKLGDAHLDASQKAAFSDICGTIDRAVKLSRNTANQEEITALLWKAYDGLIKEAERLGQYGGAIRYLAEKVKMPLSK